MLPNNHLIQHYAKHENGMPKRGGPETEFWDAAPNNHLIQHYAKHENGMPKRGGP